MSILTRLLPFLEKFYILYSSSCNDVTGPEEGSLLPAAVQRVLANSRFSNQLLVLSPHLLDVVLRGHWVVDAVDGEDNRRQGLGILT